MTSATRAFTLFDSDIYADGTNFKTQTHARNLYGLTHNKSTAEADSVYTRLNGNLTRDNLRSSFRLERDNVWPGSMSSAFSSSAMAPVEYFSDSSPSGSGNYDESYLPERYGVIAGTSIRFFLAYRSLCLIDLSTYFSIWRPFYVDDDDEGSPSPTRDKVISSSARMRLIVDQTVACERGLPFSAQMSPAETGGSTDLGDEEDDGKYSVGDIRNHEAGQGFYMSLHEQLHLEPGWHEARLEYRLDSNPLTMYTSVKRGKKVIKTNIVAHQRLFCGLRNARVLALSRRYFTE